MDDSGIWTRGLVYGGAIALTPLLIWALSRAFPSRRNTIPQSSETAGFARLETWSQLFAIAAAWAALFLALALRVPNTPWLLGYLFGCIALAPVLLIALCTLPHGVTTWMAFWRFHEQKHRISLRFLASLYVLLSILGIVSTIMLFAHRNT